MAVWTGQSHKCYIGPVSEESLLVILESHPHAYQETTSPYTGADSTLSTGPARHDGRGHAPSHGRLQESLPVGSGGSERINGHVGRRADAGTFGHPRHGTLGFQFPFA